MGKIIHSSVHLGNKILCVSSIHFILYFVSLDPWRHIPFLLVCPAFKSTPKSGCLLTLPFAVHFHCLGFGSELSHGTIRPSVGGFSPLVMAARLAVYTGGPGSLLPQGIENTSLQPSVCSPSRQPTLPAGMLSLLGLHTLAQIYFWSHPPRQLLEDFK